MLNYLEQFSKLKTRKDRLYNWPKNGVILQSFEKKSAFCRISILLKLLRIFKHLPWYKALC